MDRANRGRTTGRSRSHRAVRRPLLSFVLACGMCPAVALGLPDDFTERVARTLREQPARVVNAAPDPAGTKPAATDEAPLVYEVSRIIVTFGHRPAAVPGDDALGAVQVVLGRRDGVLTDPEGVEDRLTTRVSELTFSPNAKIDAAGYAALRRQIASALIGAGLSAVLVERDPDQLAADGQDLREGTTELNLRAFVGEVAELRTLSVRAGSDERVENDPAVKRIADNSPVKPGEPIRSQAIDEYVLRLNRHPGRRVDVAVAAAQEFNNKDAQLSLDYLITEQKPWSIYGQVSNTGTANTDRWRERFGFSHVNLTGNDDILRIDYLTAGFSSTHAVNGSYEFPLAERLRLRGIAGYNQFTASDVGFPGRNFNGESWEAGGELVWNVFQRRSWFIDLVGGLKYQNIRATDRTGANQPTVDGDTNFLLPSIGVVLERSTETASTYAELAMEFQSSVVGTGADQADRLGRGQVDTNWYLFRWDVGQSFYLEPLLDGRTFRGEGLKPEDKGWAPGMTLAHEIQLSLRGQHSFDRRLVPNFQQVAGGFYSVRGYDESIAVGDSTILASAEYRFHLPRALRPEAATEGSFRWRPEELYGQADWDLILKGFVDAAATSNVGSAIGEKDQTLIGAGIGMEIQLNTIVRGAIRLDWGFPLKDVTDDAGNELGDRGDNRLHVSFLLVF